MMELIKGYKQTSIGIIPEDWEVKKLENLLDFKNGINSEKSNYGSGAKFINVMEVIYNNSITDDMIKGSVTVNEKEMELYSVNYGDIVFNRTSETTEEIGLSSVYLGENNKVVFGGFVIRGVFKNTEIDTFFKKYCFRSNILRKQIIKFGQGAVRSNIGQKDLEKVKIPLPPLPEQQKIADILSTWDKAIENCKKTIAHLKDRNKGLAQQLLSGKKRVKGFENTVWSSIKLKNCLKEINKFCEKDGSFEHLTLSKDGVFPKTERYNRDFLVTNEEKKYKITQKGYLCYNPANLKFGVICVNTYGTGIFSPIYVTYKILEKIDIQFAEYFFTQQNFINRVRKYEEGTVYERQAVKSSDFCKAYVTIPSIIEQKEIAKILYSASLELKTYEEKLQTLQQQKKGLMQQLLTGKVRVKIN